MLRWAVVVTVVFLSAAAPAQAGLSMQVDSPHNIIKPEIGSGAGNITLTLDCQTALKFNPAVTSTLPFSVAFTANATLHVTGPSTILMPIGTCVSASHPDSVSVKGAYTVTTTRDLEGLKIQPIPVKVTTTAKGVDGTTLPDQSGTMTASSDYFPYIQAVVVNKIVEAGPGKEATFNVLVSNLGNAQTVLSFALGDPAPDAKWKVSLPPQVVLDSPASGAKQTTGGALLVITTPYHDGWNNEDQAFTITITPAATKDTAKTGLSITISVLARDRGCYSETGNTPAACEQGCAVKENTTGCDGAKASFTLSPPLSIVTFVAVALLQRRLKSRPSGVGTTGK